MMTLRGKLTVKYKREPNHSGPDKRNGAAIFGADNKENQNDLQETWRKTFV